jgi:nucleoside-diphosphate-sugar epimerase
LHLEGTLNVLEGVKKNQNSVKRLVYTSSLAAVLNFNDLGVKELNKDRVYNESDWNLTSDLQDGPYRYAKRIRFIRTFILLIIVQFVQ